jgi:2-polyprenyl-3-methyl-5-hydroxy-6-metoxy-1,4-benzoquinol methylase
MASPTLAKHHATEAAYFDAQPHNVGYVTRSDLHRYSNPGTLYPIDCMFLFAGDVAGKRVLDVGCGNGENAVMLAKLGASVTGLDISLESIRAAEERCRINMVVAQFVCSPLESAELGKFDLIWIDAFLHHMLHDLPNTILKLRDTLAPGGVVLIKEPVAESRWLRRLRLSVGKPEGTPDERPLLANEIKMICTMFGASEVRRYRAAGRLEQWVSPRLLAWIDRALLLVPGMGRFASVAVIRCR